MADNRTNTAENRMLDWLFGGTPTAPETPLQIALVTALGDDATAGTEVTGGSYARQTVTVAAASGGTVTNSGDLIWENMPACTVVGAELWDSATPTPVRWTHMPFTSSRTIEDGDEFKIAAGEGTWSLS